jgi:uncharacterized membrane-anchored protein YjiN (DUF445 family)
MGSLLRRRFTCIDTNKNSTQLLRTCVSNKPVEDASGADSQAHEAPTTDEVSTQGEEPTVGQGPPVGEKPPVGENQIVGEERPAGEEPTSGEASAPPHDSAALDEARVLTRTRARDLRSLLARYIRQHLPDLPAAAEVTPEPPRAVGAHARILPFLVLIPWVLAALFAFSFVWDFPDVELSAFGLVLEVDGLLRILSVSGLIGFLTNWLAITMLFNPRERRPIFGQGLIPAQRERVIFRLAKAVSEELINEEIIKKKIEESGVIPKYRDVTLAVTRGVVEDPEFRRELKALTADYLQTVLSSDAVRHKIADFLGEKLEKFAGKGVGGFALRAYRFLNEEDFQRRIESAVQQIPSNLDTALDELDAVLDRVPEKIEARSEEIERWVTRIVLGFVENLDVYNIIIGNIERYDERQLEALIKNTSNEQLDYIKYLGGVLGCIGGFVIWRPFISLIFFAAIGGLLYLIDEALYRRGKA